MSTSKALPGRNRSRLAPVSATERVLNGIEKGSKTPFGRWDYGRQLIDTDLLRGFHDPDEIDYEESVCRRYDRSFKTIDEFADGMIDGPSASFMVAVDFRDKIDLCDCDHERGHVCIKCCTEHDVAALPPMVRYRKHNMHRETINGFLQMVFDLIFEDGEAERAGLLDAVA